MKFRFDELLIFNQYLFRKINLLYDARIINKDMMIQYFYDKLNFNFMLTISLRKNDDILKNFEKQICQNE